MISPVSTSTILSSRTCPPMRKGRPRKGAPTLLAVQVGIAGTLDGSRVLAELVAPLGDGSGNPLHAEEITNPRVSEVRILEGVGNGLLLAVRVDGPGELVVAVHQIDDTPGPTLVGGNPVGLGNDLALDLVTLLLQLAICVVLVVNAVRVGCALPALDAPSRLWSYTLAVYGLVTCSLFARSRSRQRWCQRPRPCSLLREQGDATRW